MDGPTPIIPATIAATGTAATTTTSVVVDLTYGENDNIKCPPMVTGTVYQARVPTVAATLAATKLCQQKAQHQQRQLCSNTHTNNKTSGSSGSSSGSESDDEEDDDSEESDSDSDEEEGCSAVNDRDVCLDLLSTIETNLKQTVADILFQNPWLASTLRSNPQYTLKDTVRTKNNKYGLQALKNSGILMSGSSDHSSNSNSNSNSNSKHHHKSKYQLEYPTALTRDECHRYADKVVRVITTVSAGGGNRHCPTASVPCADKTIAAMDLILADPITENTYKELVDAVRPFLPKNTESNVVAKGTTTANGSTDDGGAIPSPSNEMTMLWDILLIPLTDSKTSFWNCKFLMVHSLDRAVADTTTYYNVYAMLSTTGTTTIQALNPTRNNDVEQIKRDLLEDVDPNFLRSPAVQAGCAKRLVQVGTDQMKNSTVVANIMASSQKLSSSVLKKTVPSPSEERSGNSEKDASNSSSSTTTTTPTISTNQTSVWFCDETKIKTIQKDYRNQLQQQQEDVEVERNADTSASSTVRSTSSTGISANDIIASWFLRQNKDAPIGCIVTDIRARHPDLPQNLAGNYEAEVIYNTPFDVQHPAMIQASLNRPDGLLKRCGATHNSGSCTDEHELPDAKTLSGGLFSKYAPGNTRVLNWSSVYEPVVLKQSDTIQLVPECHIPIYLQHQSGIHNSIGWNTLIMFRWSEEKLGLLIMAPPSATDDNTDPENEAPIIRPQIMSPP